MFLTPRFVPKTVEELKGQSTDNAELSRQEARLKQQVLSGWISCHARPHVDVVLILVHVHNVSITALLP